MPIRKNANETEQNVDNVSEKNSKSKLDKKEQKRAEKLAYKEAVRKEKELKKQSRKNSINDENTDTTTCPVCKRPLTNNAKFCPNCGTNLAIKRNSKKKGKKLKKELERLGGEGTAQCTNDLTGFRMMFENGIAESTEGVFSRTVEFGDISYEHERRDIKDDIFVKFSALHGSFRAGQCYQINLINLPLYSKDTERLLDEVGPNADLAKAYNEILYERQREGRTDFIRKNYLTFAIEAEDDDSATRLLASIRSTVQSHFTRLGLKMHELNGYERVVLLHDLVKGNHEPLYFTYDRLLRTSKLHTRDFVAPAWAAYSNEQRFLRKEIMMPGRFVKLYHIKDFGADLSDRAIRTIRGLPIPMNISLLFRPQPTGESVEKVNRNINTVQAEMYDYSRAVAKNGGDPTLLPPALEDKEAEGRELRDFIRDKDQIVSWFQGFIMIWAKTREELQSYHELLMNEKQTWSLDITELPLRQEEALVSSLPLATPHLSRAYRSLTTSESAALIPFSSQNIHDDPKKSLLLGVDQVSNELLLIDPNNIKGGHGWIFGITGSGKGMEINSLLTYSLLQHPRTEYDPISGKWVCGDIEQCPEWHIFDFHSEYVSLGKRFDAEISKFGPAYESCLNLMAMGDAAGELSMKDVTSNIDLFISLFESVMGQKLEQRQKSLIDRCLNVTFAPYINTDKRPTLADFYKVLRNDKSPVAIELADSLEMYVEGTMNSFAGQTNVAISPYLNIYDMSELGETMQTIGMLSALQHVRQRSYSNYKVGRQTYLLLEECQILFDNDAAVRLLDKYFSELRKFGLHIFCVTQLPSRVLEHKRASNLFENSGFFVLLPQQANNVDLLADRFKLSESQAEKISTSAQEGTGLVIADGIKIAFSNRIKKGNILYDIWNTDPDKLAKLKKKNRI